MAIILDSFPNLKDASIEKYPSPQALHQEKQRLEEDLIGQIPLMLKL